jgi:hypothetical protein
MMPSYLGMIPGIAAFLALNKLPLMKKLGYFGSFTTSGLVGLTVYAASAFAMFKAITAIPQSESGGNPLMALIKGTRPGLKTERPAYFQGNPWQTN